MSFDLDKNKMRCFMVLDDSLGPRLSRNAAPAFWRAFILEDRTTHEIYAKMRFSYISGEKTWFQLRPNQNLPQDQLDLTEDQIVESLRCGLEDAIKLANSLMGIDPVTVEHAIKCFYPPDDQGDPVKTIIWLEEQNLIEIEVKLGEEEGQSDV